MDQNMTEFSSVPFYALDHKFSLDEYHYEMQHYTERIKLHPSKTDVNDQLYLRKYAHTMPPLIVYKCRPPNVDHTNVKGNDNYRKVYYGWNNVTEHEKQGIERVREWLRQEKNTEVPGDFLERDLLKFV